MGRASILERLWSTVREASSAREGGGLVVWRTHADLGPALLRMGGGGDDDAGDDRSEDEMTGLSK